MLASRYASVVEALNKKIGAKSILGEECRVMIDQYGGAVYSHNTYLAST